MSLRDWFAGQALAGLLPICAREVIDRDNLAGHSAKTAYQIADAMLRQRGR